ncbi:uncharacterized protein LOC113341872 [Papaver somniferum]|uniref:uncharacterized protein LOC113341872 n=1 Tax=Papaver somniferum TaxID=3469 RepID=UPI000E6F4707|nr:uncharacterized protein LOC113341872 [Papaver somniferum]
MNKQWVIIGDMNVVLHAEENKSIFAFNNSEVFFNNLINLCGLIDLCFSSYTFTWNNHKKNNDIIEQRRDRALGNSLGITSFPNSSIKYLGHLASDHVPIVLNTHNTWNDEPTPFKYFGDWIKHEECKPLIQACWEKEIRGSHAHTMIKKVTSVKHILRGWNKYSFGNIRTNIEMIKDDLKKTNSRSSYPNKNREIANLRNKLTEWYNIQESFWKDKSRDQNIMFGDRNTRYFHARAKQRFRRNKIETLKDKNDVWVNSRPEIVSCITKHFLEITTTVNPCLD